MILVTGSLAFDYIMDFPGSFSEHIMSDKIHVLNLSFLLTDLKKQFGGTAGNISYSLGLLKTPVSILATAGDDFSPYSEKLKNAGVDISQIQSLKNEFTASAFIMTDKNDNQITGFYPGAMSQASKLTIASLGQKPEFAVISPNDPQAMLNFSLECQKLSIPYMIDPGMQLPSLDPKDLSSMVNGAQILIGNDYEIGLLKKKLNINDQDITDHVNIVVTTYGNQGSQIEQPNGQIIRIKAATPDANLDPTGAGDAYRAGFLAGFIKKLDLKTSAQIGATAACYVVEKYGTTSHTFTLEEFTRRYKENFGEELVL